MIKKIFLSVVLISMLALAGYFYINGYFSTSDMDAQELANAKKIQEKMDRVTCGVSDPTVCETDDDCVCAAEETKYPGCFLGNKYYYEKCEDKSQSCADNCYGWGQPPVKCINGKCSNSYDRLK